MEGEGLPWPWVTNSVSRFWVSGRTHGLSLPNTTLCGRPHESLSIPSLSSFQDRTLASAVARLAAFAAVPYSCLSTWAVASRLLRVLWIRRRALHHIVFEFWCQKTRPTSRPDPLALLDLTRPILLLSLTNPRRWLRRRVYHDLCKILCKKKIVDYEGSYCSSPGLPLGSG